MAWNVQCVATVVRWFLPSIHTFNSIQFIRSTECGCGRLVDFKVRLLPTAQRNSYWFDSFRISTQKLINFYYRCDAKMLSIILGLAVDRCNMCAKPYALIGNVLKAKNYSPNKLKLRYNISDSVYLITIICSLFYVINKAMKTEGNFL